MPKETGADAPANPVKPIQSPSDIESIKAAFATKRRLEIQIGGDVHVVEYRQLNRLESELVRRVLRRTVIKRTESGQIQLDDPESERSRVQQQARADALSLAIGWEALKQQFPIDAAILSEDDAKLDQIVLYLGNGFPDEFITTLRLAIEGTKFDVVGQARNF